ncbi:copper-binding protein [Pseudomonas sp. MMS21-TM103]|uniref:copper-binding protein n=1 Tax=Pseudomonas sp. MMS21 TM103 TaxID=2886506 RepID=UPI001EDE5554|nr:copper-binding protein [Pseudomonas sp. MMS21 TM103]MCG4455871.1 copper-binding protein [Pseudomonas sp. MMS21 TM103]
MNYSLLGALTLVLGQPLFAAEMPAMPMDEMPMKEMQMEQSGAAATAQASGTVKAIDSQKGSITIAHGPVPALKWPAMTMGFKATPGQLSQVQVGQQVIFQFKSEVMQATLLSIKPLQQ